MENYHSLKVKSVIQKLKSNEQGLPQEEAEKRFKHYGPNQLPRAKPLGKLLILFSQFHNSLVYILLFAGVLSIILGQKIDAGVIFGAVLINVIIGFFQENKANQAIVKLKNLVEQEVYVLRDGQEKKINSNLVVIGDILLIEAGNRISADARLIEANDLQINEAALTGESIPSTKTNLQIKKGAALADRENMVYAGTMALHGMGRAIVTATGKKTEIGKIAELVKGAREEKTPLQARLAVFSGQLGILFAVICLLLVIVGLSQGRSFLEMIETGVAVGVASIPEGLTVAVTFILALGMQQILRRRALVRKLIAAETLGSTTVICSDKTGTLTEGKMHVAHIVVGEKEFEIKTPGTRQNQTEAKAASLALQTAMMCNKASVENPHDELASWRFIGSPTETALLSAAIQSGLNREELLKIEPSIQILPFDSDKKYMISLHQKSNGSYILYEKGAPEMILAKSTKFHHQGKINKLTNKWRKSLNSTYEKLTSQGLRVIALANKSFTSQEKFEEKKSIDWELIDHSLVFIGFIAIKDPLRPEAKETIGLCRQAGIKPIIITGDHKLTARAIAEEVGIKAKAENIITGEELDKTTDEKLKELIRKIDIYARVSPHHKLRIVKALQDDNQVVAMTGDGINDSPALKAADIGISLGTGTDIAKETSDIVLLDNNFKTIISAVEQGRIIFKNIRKVITYLISDSFSEVILIIGSILFNAPLAILPVQILWINIINDGFPDFSLAFEGDHAAVMNDKPYPKHEALLTKQMRVIIFGVGIIRDIILFCIFLSLWQVWKDNPDMVKYLQTAIFAVLGVKSLMTIFSLRSFAIPVWRMNPLSNKYMVAAVSFSAALLVAGVHWPPLQSALSTTSLSIQTWMLIICYGIFSVLLVELAKHFFPYSRNKPI